MPLKEEPIIQVKHLSKQYKIGADTTYKTLSGSITDTLRSPLKTLKNFNKQNEIYWALKDINFEVNRGEVVGIIGRNGAGKSTLLKVLSRITHPTEGEVTLRGRVGSLLEVGTGFHPELTGRENVYFNGAILGMKKREIDAKFDEIVKFAEIEQFLDTPVKRYSSGMYVRLAFAVAAHMDPEILMVDEVLAVGDVAFQKKCLGKMKDVSEGGRTVLFVSHNMAAVKKLCPKGILLENGSKTFQGNTNEAVDYYLNGVEERDNFKPFQIKELDILIKSITLNEENNGLVTPFKPLRIDIEIDAERDISNIGVQIMISHDDTTGVVFATNTALTKNIDMQIKRGNNKVSCLIDRFNLCSGRYWLGFGIDIPFVKWHYYDLKLLSFDAIETLYESCQLPTISAYGHVYLDHNWIYSN